MLHAMWKNRFVKMTHDRFPEQNKLNSWEATGTKKLLKRSLPVLSLLFVDSLR